MEKKGLAVVTASASLKAEVRFGKGKMEFLCRGFEDQRSLCHADLTASSSSCVDAHICLGVPLDPEIRMHLLMRQIQSRGVFVWNGTMVAMALLRLPAMAMLAALHSRVLPKILYGCEFVETRHDWQPKFDSLLDGMLSNFLNLDKKVSRARLLTECGIQQRLSTTVAVRAQ